MYFFENLPNNLKDNYEFFLYTAKYNSYYLKYTSDNLKNNYDIVLAAVKKMVMFLHMLQDDLKNNYNIILNTIVHDYYYGAIYHIPLKFIKNRKLIVNMNNSKYFYKYNENIIIKIKDYKFEIKENRLLLKQNLYNIFKFF